MKRNKRMAILAVLMLAVFSCSMLSSFAIDSMDPGRTNTLTVDYHYQNVPVPGVSVSAYRIATVDQYGNPTLQGAFRNYPVSLQLHTADVWDLAANTLYGYALLDGIAPDATGVTDSNGRVQFPGLAAGYYLVVFSSTAVDDYVYYAKSAIVCLPGYDYTAQAWQYNVQMTPKISREKKPDEPSSKTVNRKVLKVWKDAGYDEQRPQNITVCLLQNGIVIDTVTLSEATNWRYEWKDLPYSDEDGVKYEYAIVENEVKGYQVSVEIAGVTFEITNTIPGDVPPPDDTTTTQPTTPTKPGTTTPTTKPSPKLPNTGQLWWPVPVLLAVGLMCLAIGVVVRKNKKEEEA